jgi:GH35 family endo-1,4-beta-xylanase
MEETEILAGAEERIEKRRKADATVRVIDDAGAPIAGARVRAEQVRHAFLFGCNAFPVLELTDPERERTYEKEFSALLNYATLAFYWGFYEPQPGQTRAEQLQRQARWCKERGMPAKGHPLIWHEVYPEWGPSEPEETRRKLQARVTEIVSGFAGLVDIWDVVNEATVSHKFDNGVGRWARRDGAARLVGEALEWARAANPKATLVYNEYNISPEFEQLVADLIEAGRPFDVIGIQSHMHGGEWPLSRVWHVCETYARFGKPLHFTETTVVSGEHGWERPQPWPSTPEGEAFQAEYVEKLYTTLFSHPAVEAITWWDFQDGAWQGAPAGLVRADLTPKPVYERLMALVKGRWWTSVDLETGPDGAARFRGFLGDYRIAVSAAGRRAAAEMSLAAGRDNAISLALKRAG